MLIKPKNPRRVAAGRLSQPKRGPWTAEQRQRVRAAIYKSRPWERSTGPRTPAGKARSAANAPNHALKRKPGEHDAALAEAKALVARMAGLRQLVVA